METHQNRHDFTQAHRNTVISAFHSAIDEARLPVRQAGLAEIVDVTEESF
ncbi:MAG: hypothetical protein WBA57_21650 [Elainellaceae cyanobacterium]